MPSALGLQLAKGRPVVQAGNLSLGPGMLWVTPSTSLPIVVAVGTLAESNSLLPLAASPQVGTIIETNSFNTIGASASISIGILSEVNTLLSFGNVGTLAEINTLNEILVVDLVVVAVWTGRLDVDVSGTEDAIEVGFALLGEGAGIAGTRRRRAGVRAIRR